MVNLLLMSDLKGVSILDIMAAVRSYCITVM